jgi:GT2 family glycosyltransferase
MLQPKIAIIILNWNGWKDTIECLESLYQITYENYIIFLMDNASTDDSIFKIAEYCEGNIPIESPFFTYSTQNKPVALFLSNRAELDGTKSLNRMLEAPAQTKLLLIKNERNYGFAEANNIGIRYALETQDPDYFLLLNNDTVVDKQFLTELVGVAESDRSIGIVGPKTYYYYEPNKIQLAWNAFDFNTGRVIHTGAGDIDKGQYDAIKQTGYVPGSCLLVKKEVVKEVGLLDSRFFTYWEETDFCTRAKKAGYKCIYCWQAKIWHKISSSSKDNVLPHYYGTRNMFWFMQKHATKRQYVSFLLYFAGYQFWFAIASLIIKQADRHSFFLFLKGTLDGIKGYVH